MRRSPRPRQRREARREGGTLRTCVGCRAAEPKAELLRVAASAAGVSMDPRAVRPGRGAYVHRDLVCVEAAVRTRGLARALRVTISPEEASNLLTDVTELIGKT